MQEMGWQGFFLRVLGVIVVAIVMYIFTSLVTTHFGIGNVAGVWIAVIFIMAIVGILLHSFLEASTFRTWLTAAIMVFVVLSALRATADAYSPTAVDSMDRGEGGAWLAIGKLMNPDYYMNDTVNHTYNKQCEVAVAKKRAAEEDKALKDYENDSDLDGQALARYNKARMDINQKYQEVVQCKKDLVEMPPAAPIRPITDYYPVVQQTSKTKSTSPKTRRYRTARRCIRICEEGKS